MIELVLASTSPYRRALLEQLGLTFACMPPGVDEAALRRQVSKPEDVAITLAQQKALAVATRAPAAIVIGSDQVCALGDELFDKPGSVATAVAQLVRLQGREHRLITAVAIAHPKGLIEFHDVTRLRMRPLAEAELRRYVAADQPLDCAGAYKIERRGIALFEAITTADHSSIIGLPLLRLCTELRQLGIAVP